MINSKDWSGTSLAIDVVVVVAVAVRLGVAVGVRLVLRQIFEMNRVELDLVTVQESGQGLIYMCRTMNDVRTM